ncbi:hypothetical protein EV356DRAFT_535412 [Viridothelium virens]|uniref:DUF7708 domain-containing protein n=1 Tax=Viridothelium virens TaxID=1048519 RepID=A0A6A6H1X8_VIRVR|nr:hypothetical protein EV356DRAFT_535412 [Viridothelium virens]
MSETRAEREGYAVARRFADELDETSDLSRETRLASIREIIEKNEKDTADLEQDYGTLRGNPRNFDAAQVARDELRKCCEHFVASQKESKWILKRKSAKIRANERLQEYIDQDIDEVKLMVYGLDTNWKENHQGAYKNFSQICDVLASHKDVFAIFPSQNIYTSVLCGSISMLVQAAVNHEQIADTISTTLAEISDRAIQCKKYLHSARTSEMERRLSSIYSKVFAYYREIMSWYLAPKVERFFKSFNDKVNDQFGKMSQAIKTDIELLKNEADAAHMAMTRSSLMAHKYTMEGLQVVDDKIDRIGETLRQQRRDSYRDFQKGYETGQAMFQTFLATFEKVTLTGPNGEVTLSKPGEQLLRAATPEMLAPASQSSTEISRDQALLAARHLKEFIVGDSGVSYLAHSQTRLIDGAITFQLKQWLELPNKSQSLWMYGRIESQFDSTMRDASLAMISTAFQAKAPFISHVCERPHQTDLGTGQTADKAGLLGLVYSLIHQLLEFDIQNQKLPLSADRLEKLDGSSSCWNESLNLLQTLLDATPHLRYCIIHGLNIFEWSDGADWCVQLVDVLLRHQEQQDVTFSILFTTAGQSRILTMIPFENRYESTRSVKDTSIRGERLEASPAHRRA